MKNKYPFLFLVMIFTACSWELPPDKTVVGTVQEPTVKLTESAMLDSAYATLRRYPNHTLVIDVDADIMMVIGSNNLDLMAMKSSMYTPNTLSITEIWNHCIISIRKINQYLGQNNGVQTTAELRGMRGFYHFWLRNLFNAIPIIKESNNTGSLENGNFDSEVWPFIEADFKYAYENLPAVTGYGRLNKWAAGTFLAKAYLYEKKFTEAKPLLDLIIANGGYSLAPSMLDNFKVQNETSTEIIFAIPFDRTTKMGMFIPMVMLHPASKSMFGLSYEPWNAICADPAFYRLFESIDNRSKMWLTGQQYDVSGGKLKDSKGKDLVYTIDLYDNSNNLLDGLKVLADQVTVYESSGARWNKFEVQRSNTTFNQDNDYPLLRLADVLLMAAEAEIEVGALSKATQYLNQVRTRSGAPFQSLFADKESARSGVRKERAMELAGEGERKFDLVRWGIFGSSPIPFKQVIKGKHEYWPIPASAIQANPKLIQNPGY